MLDDEQDAERFKVLWAGGMALLRTVGDALHRIYGERDKVLKAQIKLAYDRWKKEKIEDSIFFGFIKLERDNLLHEFWSYVASQPKIDVLIMQEFLSQNEAELYSIEADIYKPYYGTYGNGEDCRDLFQEAIDWWDVELTKLENLSI